jgi:hypothetical protein
MEAGSKLGAGSKLEAGNIGVGRLRPTDDLRRTAAGLARHLERFSASLDERDRQLLAQILLGAMDPVERMVHVHRPELLSAEEEDILRALRTEYERE